MSLIPNSIRLRLQLWLAFLLICLLPSLRLLQDDFRSSLLRIVQYRFERVLWASIAGLTISGIYNWIQLAPKYRLIGPLAQALIGIKVLLAAIIFGVVFARSANLLKPSRFWPSLNLHLAALVILLAAILRWYRLQL